VVGFIVKLPLSPVTLLIIPVIVLTGMFSHGVAMIFATMQVYFRDTAAFLPYFLRIWLYASPVLYFAFQLPGVLRTLAPLNPLFPLMQAWSDIIILGQPPTAAAWALSLVWAVVALVVGQLLFMSRERDFAVRL
jgi:teichoic acid transport system permease protein